MTKKIALFPGSFDPITKGHESLIKKASLLFDEVVVGLGFNSKKKYMFTLEQREDMIKKTFENIPNISVQVYKQLTVSFCKEIGATYIIRGLRNSTDFDFEQSIAYMNKSLEPQIESVFLLTDPRHMHISSTIVREVYLNNGEISTFIPDGIVLPKL